MQKIWIGTLITAVIGAILFMVWPFTNTEEKFISYWNEKWEMQLPSPDRIETIIQTEMPARGDGEWLYALFYTEPLQYINELGFEQVTSTNHNEVERLINKFQQDTVNTHLGNQKKQKAVTQAFQQLNTAVIEKDFYRYFAKNGGQDYYIAYYQPEHNRLLIYEWHQ